ncbi:MAG: helix-turn-helix domain-containing protein [Oscillospiraceae bacterium]
MHKKVVATLVDFDRLEALINKQGIKKSHLCKLAGHSRGYISDAKAGKGSISEEALEIFAKELGTTVAYLTGASDDQSPEGITQRDFDLLAAYHAADDATRAAIDLLLEKFQRT